MGRLFLEVLSEPAIYACKKCMSSQKEHCSSLGRTNVVHLASKKDLISKVRIGCVVFGVWKLGIGLTCLSYRSGVLQSQLARLPV